MGSKVAMLDLGLSDIISNTISLGASRFIDLFSGSGSVARWVAENHAIPVDSVDSQLYAKALSGAIIERSEEADLNILMDWISSSRSLHDRRRKGLTTLPDVALDSTAVYRQRSEAEQIEHSGFIARDYGGHYFSLDQALALDCLMENLPETGPERSVALASVIEAASMCAASPGHTAQPFQPTGNLIKHIDSAWRRDPFSFASRQAISLASRFSLASGGNAFQRDALIFARNNISERSVVFCDPPYSDVQYSRFYHVLEGIARGGWSDVHGAGRAPIGSVRFSSTFSSRKMSTDAFTELFSNLAQNSATVILTFPNQECSNGQSAESLSNIASQWFEVASTPVDVTHSSLGSPVVSAGNRMPRKTVEESVMVFSPLV